MRTLLLSFAAGSLCLSALSAQEAPAPAAPAQETPQAAAEQDYIRFTEDAKTGRLETAVRRFTGPDGLEVDLVGVVHIADKSYYQQLDKKLATEYDAVLYELVGDPDAMPRRSRALKRAGDAAKEPEPEKKPEAAPKKEKPSMLGIMQRKMGEILKLDFQLEHIDYDRENFIHADMTWQQFESEQAKKGESFLKLFLRSLRMQADPEMAKLSEDINSITPGILLKLMLNRDVSADLKLALARMFDKSERMTSTLMEGKDGSVILSGRNKVASEKLAEIIKSGKKKISIFYGAAHLPGLEALMVKDHGLTPKDTQWLAAWTIEKPKPKKAKVPEEQKP